MGLADRVENFAEIIKNSECTTSNSEKQTLESGIEQAMQDLIDVKDNHATLYIVGNGGSAAVASHALVDFVNVAKIKAQVLHESSLITCMANDYGYEESFARVLDILLQPNDLLIAISSSGKSLNIHKAVHTAVRKGCKAITFSGFDAANPLRGMGSVNFWLDTSDYGYVEVGHQLILHNLADRFALMYL